MKNEIISNQNDKIKEYENKIKIIEKNFSNIKQKNNVILNENNLLKNENNNLNFQIENLKIKQIKLMQVLYLIKEKGIDIDEVLQDVSNLNNNNNNDNNKNSGYFSFSSDRTFYFPDKIHMKNIMEDPVAKKVPILDFKNIPVYQSDSDDDEDNNNDSNNNIINNILLPSQEGMKFNKINFTNEEQFYNNSN